MSASSPRLLVLFANVGHTLTHMLMLLYPTVVLTLEGRMQLGYGELMWLAVPGMALYGVAALPAGWLGDRWSAERMMVLFFIGSGLGCLATGLASGPLGIGAGLALVGFFGSIYHPVGTAWLVRNAVNRGRMLGWNGIFGQLGIGAAPFTAGALTQLFGWRAAFLVPGLLCLVLGIALMLLVRGGSVAAARSDRRPQSEPLRSDVRRAFIMLSITMVAAGVIMQAMTNVLPKLFEQRLAGFTDGGTLGTGTLVSIVFLVSGGFPMLGGWLADRYSMRWIYVLAWAAEVPLLFAATHLLGLPLFAVATAVFCLISVAVPTENSLLARYTPSRWRATAFGAKFVLSLGVSALGVPLVATVYDRTHDFVWLFVILGALAMVVVAAGLLLPRDRHEAAPAPAPAE
ncbi:MAG TPA: MFS transporter [Stellaceae bacterium]|nr:MFS transporter [Stellaceae bacterium]